MYDAINKGISLSQGDVLAYLNSDDFYFPWSVDVAVGALRHGIELIYGDMGILRAETSTTRASFSIQFYPDFSMRHYAFVATMGQPTVFWRRSLSEKIGLFDVSYRLIGDCEYWLRAALRGAKLRHIPELIAVQVEHGSTLRATQADRLSEEFDMLRHAMATRVDPPSSLRWERLKRSVAWRVSQLEFFYAMKAKQAHKWRASWSICTLVASTSMWRDLRLLAPARWRGDVSLFGDALGVDELAGGPERP